MKSLKLKVDNFGNNYAIGNSDIPGEVYVSWASTQKVKYVKVGLISFC